MKTPPAQIVMSDADGLINRSEPALLVLQISRREIESGNIASALERLHVVANTPESVHLYKESLIFQVAGYDQDSRELPEIPQVRTYFARLVQEWPHWMWFLVRDMGSVALLLSLLCPVKVIRGPSGQFGTEFVDVSDVHRVFEDLLGRSAALVDAGVVTEDEFSKSEATAINEIFS